MEADEGVQLIRPRLDEGQVDRQQGALRVELLQIGGITGLVAIDGVAQRFGRRRPLRLQPRPLLAQALHGGEIVLHLAKGGEDGAAIGESRLVTTRRRRIDPGAEPAASKIGASTEAPIDHKVIGLARIDDSAVPAEAVRLIRGMNWPRATARLASDAARLNSAWTTSGRRRSSSDGSSAGIGGGRRAPRATPRSIARGDSPRSRLSASSSREMASWAGGIACAVPSYSASAWRSSRSDV